MYRIEKKFTLPIGHRLSKHKGKCFSIHGHNFSVLVGLKSEKLNENDMIVDFSELKRIVNQVLDDYDHKLVVSSTDEDWIAKLSTELNIQALIFDSHGTDPTAERMAEQIFKKIDHIFQEFGTFFDIEYVTVYENENSKATYSID